MKFVDGIESIQFKEILELYKSVGWSAYTDKPLELEQAIANSTYVVCAIKEEQLIGLARSVSDGISIHYLQDILVHPDYQHQGIGRELIKRCSERFKHVRNHMLLTDDEKKQHEFYKSMGYKNTKELKEVKLNAFVKIKDFELK